MLNLTNKHMSSDQSLACESNGEIKLIEYYNPAFVDGGETVCEGQNERNLKPIAENNNVININIPNDELSETENCFVKTIKIIQNYVYKSWDKIRKPILLFIYILLFLAYNAYLGYALYFNYNEAKTLLGITIAVYLGLIYFKVIRRFLILPMLKHLNDKPIQISSKFKKCIKWGFYFLILIAVIVFLAIDTVDNRSRLISLAGLLIFILLGCIFSHNAAKINWKTVFCGVILQFIFGLIILRWQVGKDVFQWLGDKVQALLAFTDKGTEFLFTNFETHKFLITFAFKVLPVVIFFSFLISLLYYLGVMQWVVMKIGWLLQIIMGTTAAESMNAAANIFIGQTEAPLLIAPYLPLMTKSELHAVMTGGFATIAGSVLAAYIQYGVNASDLLSASVMSAPAALAVSKLFYPEVEQSLTTASQIKLEKSTYRNAIEAASEGASNAIALVANIAANLIAFLAALAMFDSILGWLGYLVGVPYLSFSFICSKVFIPLSFIMGVQWKDCEAVAKLIGIKTILNEFIAYTELGKMIKEKEISSRSQVIATYALCGFSNIASLGIQLGGIGALAPQRKRDLAVIGVRALIAGTVACFMTACIAGILTKESDIFIRNTTLSS